jgi:hypothetical protein
MLFLFFQLQLETNENDFFLNIIFASSSIDFPFFNTFPNQHFVFIVFWNNSVHYQGDLKLFFTRAQFIKDPSPLNLTFAFPFTYETIEGKS